MNNEKQKWVLLIILSIIWGSSFILIKKSLEHYTPYQVGALRVLISGIVLLPVALKNIKLFPTKNIKWLVLAALCGNFFPMFLFPMAETQISSSIAGIVNSMMPIFVILIGSLLWKFPTNKIQIIGVLVSFSGACVLTLGSHDNGSLKIIPILLLLLATLMYAISTTTVKFKLHNIPAKILSAYVFGLVLTLPSLFALIISGFFSDFKLSENHIEGLGYILILSLIGTGLAMMINYKLLSISTPLFASTTTLLMPIIAIIWGIIDGEKLSFIQYIGGAIIIAGLLFLRSPIKKEVSN